MKIAALQMDIAWEDPAENQRRASRLLAGAAEQGAELAILPEMFCTGFSMNAASAAEDPDGPVERYLSGQAREHGIYLLGTRAVRGRTKPRNEALLHAPDGSLVARQAKLHPFSFANEHEHFEPGARQQLSPVGPFQLGIAICYDLRFPELFRSLTLRGATLMVVVANWPTVRSSAWSHLLVSRAIENQCYVVGVNRVGRGGGLDYNGCSAIIDPMGQVLETAIDVETALVADLDPRQVDHTREQMPFLADIREDLWPCLRAAD